MWSQQKFLFIFCNTLCCVSRAAGLVHVYGYEGSDVTVMCSYDPPYDGHVKYLCRNNCGNGDVLITTKNTNSTKYFIYDDIQTRITSVTISKLMDADGGQYWCGVAKFLKDIYSEIQLVIKEDFCCAERTVIQSFTEASISITCPYESEYKNNFKFLCRGNRPSTCLKQAVITSHSSHDKRFTLIDDESSRFTVKIINLTVEDSGLYLCGIQKNTGLDVFSAVDLQVEEWCCVQSVNMSGTVGHPVTLQCLYPSQHQENKKFICKGDKHSTCTDMTNHSRFTLHNVSFTSFLVTITDLEASDAGMYWCGSDRQWNASNYMNIHMSVDYQQVLNNSSHLSENLLHGFTLYLILSAFAGLLILLSILLLVYNCKRTKIRGKPIKTDPADSHKERNCDNLVYHATLELEQNTNDHFLPDHIQPVYENFSPEPLYISAF